MGNELIEALRNALVFGMSLTLLVTTLVQTIKNMLGLEGNVVKLIALGIGTLVGSLYLIFLFQPLPVEAFDYVVRVGAAFVWSFTSPEFYQLLKQTSQRGTEEALDEAPVVVVVQEEPEEDYGTFTKL